ncbi:MAG: hypothetical protein MAG715_00772 [Methanonatronarchaeales archaeon]|nr:hypothetical protein [Methanonatronarchaeales archaeon]
MGNVQVRLPDEVVEELERLAEEMHSSRSEAARNAISEGLKSIRTRVALERYVEGEFSLARAAEYAGTSLQRMATLAAERGVPYLRSSVSEVEREVEAAREAVEG